MPSQGQGAETLCCLLVILHRHGTQLISALTRAVIIIVHSNFVSSNLALTGFKPLT